MKRGTLTMSVAEYADAVGVATSTVYDRVRRGEIPNVGAGDGHRVLIPRSWFLQQFADAGAPLGAQFETVAAGTFS
jgi:excisionase family DNA binding protein